MKIMIGLGAVYLSSGSKMVNQISQDRRVRHKIRRVRKSWGVWL